MAITFDFARDLRPAASHQLLKISDGDTPAIMQSVRMVSIDTPEKSHYAGGPAIAQAKLDKCRGRLEDGFYPDIPGPLRTYLLDRLDAGAAERHITAGEEASAHFDAMLNRRLTRDTGTRRPVATIPTGEVIDRYGRLLAYLAPWFTGGTSDPIPPKNDARRRTFNLDMVADGMAAPFLLYPSLPQNPDLVVFHDESVAAWTGKHGAWKTHGRKLLLGYEFRLAIKLGTAKTTGKGMSDAFARVCIDMRGPTCVGRMGWATVPPPHRLWVWLDDLTQASTDLGISLAP